jgi:hypothetical protein
MRGGGGRRRELPKTVSGDCMMQWMIGMNSLVVEGSSTNMPATPSNAFSGKSLGLLSRSLIVS